jgi:hypothetical protein
LRQAAEMLGCEDTHDFDDQLSTSASDLLQLHPSWVPLRVGDMTVMDFVLIDKQSRPLRRANGGMEALSKDGFGSSNVGSCKNPR